MNRWMDGGMGKGPKCQQKFSLGSHWGCVGVDRGLSHKNRGPGFFILS